MFKTTEITCLITSSVCVALYPVIGNVRSQSCIDHLVFFLINLLYLLLTTDESISEMICIVLCCRRHASVVSGNTHRISSCGRKTYLSMFPDGYVLKQYYLDEKMILIQAKYTFIFN